MPALNVHVRARRRPTLATTEFKRFVAGAEHAIERGTKNAEQIADQVARERLPKRGGFADYMADRLEVRRSKIEDGLRLTFDARNSDVIQINRGQLRHPVFGNDDVWRPQTIRRGFADEAMDRIGARVDAEMAKLPRGR